MGPDEGYAGFYTLREEIANSITHGIGAGLSVAGLTVLDALALLRGEVYRAVGYSIYGASLVTLYLASTLYHGLRRPRAKRVFRVVDHAAIYALIAGTCTPFLLLSTHGATRLVLLAAMWGLALLGTAYKVRYIHRFRWLSTSSYLLMGWFGAAVFSRVLGRMPPGVPLWIAAGGIAYTVGIVFYAWRRLPYGHTIWHLFVLGGSACHYVAVLLYQLRA